jgi:hypothetical protein
VGYIRSLAAEEPINCGLCTEPSSRGAHKLGWKYVRNAPLPLLILILKLLYKVQPPRRKLGWKLHSARI